MLWQAAVEGSLLAHMGHCWLRRIVDSMVGLADIPPGIPWGYPLSIDIALGHSDPAFVSRGSQPTMPTRVWFHRSYNNYVPTHLPLHVTQPTIKLRVR